MHGKFTLEIDLGNDAMQSKADVRDALNETAKRLAKSEPWTRGGEHSGRIADVNGNSVGRWTLVRED